jgi:hypothetical protein
MSTKNPYTMPGRDGMVTHKRFPKQARTQRDVKRIKNLRNGFVGYMSVAPTFVGGTFTEVKKEVDHA